MSEIAEEVAVKAEGAVTKVAGIAEKCALKLGVFVQGLLSESDGTPSSTRVLMVFFSIFTVSALGSIVYHMNRLMDIGILTAWLQAFPIITGVLSGLIVLPYTINRGFNTLPGTVSDIFKSRAGMNVPGGLLNPGDPDHHDADHMIQ